MIYRDEQDKYRVLHHYVPGLKKGEKYRVRRAAPDVNGKWDGYRTWVVHYEGDGCDGATILYVAIGDYWKVGSWSDDENTYTRFGVAKWIADLMARGISPDIIREGVEKELIKLGLAIKELILKKEED